MENQQLADKYKEALRNFASMKQVEEEKSLGMKSMLGRKNSLEEEIERLHKKQQEMRE